MAEDTSALLKRITTLEKIINTLSKQNNQQQKQISSIIAKNRNLEMRVESLIKLINRDRD